VIIIICACLLLLIPLTAIATTAEPTTMAMLDLIAAAFKAGQIWVGVGFCLMLLTAASKWVIEKFRDDIPPATMPWVAAIIGTVGALGLTLSSGLIWWQALISGLVTGAISSGLYSLVGKHFLRSKAQKARRATARQAAAALSKTGGAE